MKAITRLKQYIDYKEITNSYFEKKNELSNGYIATQLKRNADLGESILKKILDNCLDLNPIWLLTGEGSMLKSEVKKEVQPSSNSEVEALLREKMAMLEKNNALLEENNAFQKEKIKQLEQEILALKKLGVTKNADKEVLQT